MAIYPFDFVNVFNGSGKDGSCPPGSKQEIAGTEPGDDQQAAGEFKQKSRKHSQGGAGPGLECGGDVLAGENKFGQEGSQERHHQKANDGGEQNGAHNGSDDGAPESCRSAVEVFGSHADGKRVNDEATSHQERQHGPLPPRQGLAAHHSLPDATGRNDDDAGQHRNERADQSHAEQEQGDAPDEGFRKYRGHVFVLSRKREMWQGFCPACGMTEKRRPSDGLLLQFP